MRHEAPEGLDVEVGSGGGLSAQGDRVPSTGTPWTSTCAHLTSTIEGGEETKRGEERCVTCTVVRESVGVVLDPQSDLRREREEGGRQGPSRRPSKSGEEG